MQSASIQTGASDAFANLVTVAMEHHALLRVISKRAKTVEHVNVIFAAALRIFLVTIVKQEFDW